MQSDQIRQKFLEFFEKRGHKIVPSSSLIPDDPSVLLTTAGMQQFKPYLTGKDNPEERFGSKNVFSIQKSFRTSDIDEVGDTSHLTFFEMVGNFSFGGYFKEGAIPLSFEFITSPEGLGISPQKLFITAFKGDDEVPRDDEAIRIWREQFAKVGISAEVGERIFLYGREKNWWEAGPGPAGPDAEMFYDFGTPHDTKYGPTCHPNCDCGRFVEIGNDVFVQYNKTADGKYEPLQQKAIDNGRGFERLVMVMQGKKNVFETDLFAPFTALIPDSLDNHRKRIIVDHLRGAVFLITDGVRPANKEAGYVLRRILRRVFGYLKFPIVTGMQRFEPGSSVPRLLQAHTLDSIVDEIIQQYGESYLELPREAQTVKEVIREEREKFMITLEQGLREFHKLGSGVTPKKAFWLYQTYGLPLELMNDLIKEKGERGFPAITREAFDDEFAKHQQTSRAGAERKFGGHGLLLDTGELKAGDKTELDKVTRLHTATHLLNAALHQVLGDTVEQRGSDITVERARFDFRFPRKVEPAELKKMEEIVNAYIREALPVSSTELDLEDAKKSGALYFAQGRYPNRVKVYTIGGESENSAISRELCGGPHVKNTSEIGVFRIIKEESSSAGVRRIRVVVSP